MKGLRGPGVTRVQHAQFYTGGNETGAQSAHLVRGKRDDRAYPYRGAKQEK
jgi:hypothetical protein